MKNPKEVTDALSLLIRACLEANKSGVDWEVGDKNVKIKCKFVIESIEDLEAQEEVKNEQ